MSMVVNIAQNFAEAEQWDIEQQICMTPNERALELCDLTGEDSQWRTNSRREMRRFREQLAEQYILPIKDHGYNYKLYRELLQLDPDVWNLFAPDRQTG